MHLVTKTEIGGVGARDAYARGLAAGRRAVEAELEAERSSLAVLANSLADAVAQVTLYLHPDDMAQVAGPAFDILVLPDRRLIPGGVRLTGRAA